MKIHKEKKFNFVNKVFNDVYHKYDLMNDVMSLGSHRIWKKQLISWMKPNKYQKIIDVASGTGDIAKLCFDNSNQKCHVTCVEPNKKMLLQGKKKLKDFKNIKWILSPAEKLPFEDNSFDIYVISFGLRNVVDINKSLSEAYRVLKNGGRFFCLEFSKIENEIIKSFYNQYAKVIPTIGKFVVGNKTSYDYLIKSIEKFHDQGQLLKIISKNNFSNVEYRNLTNGVAAIHTGWKI